MAVSRVSEFKASDIFCHPKTTMLGQGSFGVGVLGNHRDLRSVAVKCFNQENVLDFVEELNILSKLSYEHIAGVYGFTKWKDPLGFQTFGFVMQYYEGKNLEELILNQQFDIDVLLRLRMALQISKALAFLHNFSSTIYFVHNDVKPENVLLTSDFNCKLSDFGTCSMLHKHQRSLAPIKGCTEMFSAPEVLEIPLMPPHESQDVYSFGMLLHVLLSRDLPYVLVFFSRLFSTCVRPNCEVIETFQQSLPDDGAAIISLLQSVMKRCWAQSPPERPSMLQVRDELQELYDQQNPCLVLIKVTQLFKQVNRDFEQVNQKPKFPLDRYCNRNGKFVVDKVPTTPFAPDPNIDFSSFY